MKINSILSALFFFTSMTNYANAEIVRGTTKGEYTDIFAIHDNTNNPIPDFNMNCKRMFGKYLNNKFYIKYKVNTDNHESPQFAALRFYTGEVQLKGAQNNKGDYFFSSRELPETFSEIGIDRVYLLMNENFWDVKSQIVFFGGMAKPKECWHPKTCTKHKYFFYNCVLSTK